MNYIKKIIQWSLVMQKILREPVGNDQNNIKQWTEAILSEMNAISDEAGMEVDWMGPKHRISAL